MSPTERGDITVTEPQLTFKDCINHSDGRCAGAVEYRMPLSGTGESFVRCDRHWDIRLDEEEKLRERYPEHPPPDWSHYDAGEYWSEEDY